MSEELNRDNSSYNFRPRNQVKTTNSQGKNCHKTLSPEPSTQRLHARTPTSQFAPNGNQTMATDGGQPVLDASSSLLHGQVASDTSASNPAENPMLAEIRKMFGSFSDKIEGKLDNVITDLNSLKREVSLLKSTIYDLEKSAEDTAARVHNVETEKLPQIHRNLATLKTEIEEKLLHMELHNRKQNLLFYGIPQHPREDVHVTVSEAIAKILNTPVDEVMNIPIINAHRLPTRNPAQGTGSQASRPDPMIVRFAKMVDRDKILHAFEHPPGPPPNENHAEPRQTGPRVTVRTDLPPTMKRERGRLAHIAYEMRSNQRGLKTRIKIIGSKVVLQTKKASEAGSTWSTWNK